MALLLSPSALRDTLDAISAHIAILDDDGIILGVNEPWRSFMDAAELNHPNYGLGTHYREFCARISAGDDGVAGALADGIRQVVARERANVAMTLSCEYDDGRRWFNVRVSRPRGDHECVLMTHEDITELKLAEEELRHRVEFEKLIFSISTRFIKLRPDEIDDGVAVALREIGTFCRVDRSYVFSVAPDGETVDNTHEWCAPGIEPQIDNLQGLPTGTVPWWMERLHRRETIHLPLVSELPAEAANERKILEAQNICSLVVLPMVDRGELVGFLGFDSVRSSKAWSEETVELLRLVGEMLVCALERKQASASS